jgi:pimeloyl-ACP methyl ester carboxylesterase
VADELGRRGIDGPAHLVGLSLGGWVVLEMAALGPAIGCPAASVTAFAPAGLWRDGATIPLEREEVLLHHALAVVDPFVPLLARLRFVRQLGLRKNVAHPERATRAQFTAAARALRQARGYGACDRAACDDRFDRGGRIEADVPVTVAFGDADRTLPPASSQERSLLPAHAGWVVVGDCGHAMTWDQPDTCVELIRATTARAGQPTG